MLPKKQPTKSASCSASLTVPELDQSKTTVLNTLASAHSRRPPGTQYHQALRPARLQSGEVGELLCDILTGC
jgi:hypothetical protein